MDYMTPAAFEDAMRDIVKGSEYGDGKFSPETFHINADELMCKVLTSLGYEAGVKIFENTEKWYS